MFSHIYIFSGIEMCNVPIWYDLIDHLLWSGADKIK